MNDEHRMLDCYLLIVIQFHLHTSIVHTLFIAFFYNFCTSVLDTRGSGVGDRTFVVVLVLDRR